MATRTVKSNRFRLAKQQLCTCITLFCTFLCRHCTTATWNCLISRFNDFVFLFLNFDTVFWNSTPEKFANIWRIERVGISAIKFDGARIHFLRDVFVAVAAVVAYAPYLKKGVVTLLIGHLLASHADVFRRSSRVPAPLTFSGAGTRDEPLRTPAWEASHPYPQVACVAGAWK